MKWKLKFILVQNVKEICSSDYLIPKEMKKEGI
jgi:hypothetical protein